MKELWKDIDGYEGLYMVSNLGNVKSLNYRHLGYERILVPKISNRGRLWVELTKDGKTQPLQIHRLVATAFIANPDNLPMVNHIDEDPKNNAVENLEWCTASYNRLYSINRHPERYKSTQHPIVRTRKNRDTSNLLIDQYTLSGELVRTWRNSRTIFKETGMSDWTISECCRGNRKTAYGFRWQYAT